MAAQFVTIHRACAVLLTLSGLLLVSLVPGGPIENRDFSHISTVTLLLFNLYLTVLGLGSFAVAAVCWTHGRNSGFLTLLAAGSYLWVYAFDLIGWFPQTSSAMPTALLLIEALGLLISLPMLLLAYTLVKAQSSSDMRDEHASKHYSLSQVDPIGLVAVAVVATLTIVYATLAASGQG